MTVGFFSPLPPARSGVADYSATLLRLLQEQGAVRAGDTSADLNLYHLGNNALHSQIYDRALETPGVVVLHDAVLHHFLLGRLSRDRYFEEFRYNYGEWSLSEAEALWEDRRGSAADARYFGRPMIKRVCERSLGVVVHNPAAAEVVRSHAPAVPIFQIPMLFQPIAPSFPTRMAALRAELEIPVGTVVACVLGYLRESKRIGTVLRVFERIHGECNCVLVLQGEVDSPGLDSLLRGYSRAPFLRRVPHLPAEQFASVAAITDIGINLRWPSSAETSAIGLHLMGIGKPVLATEDLALSTVPADACIRISSGVGEAEHLAAVLRWLMQRPAHRAEIGRRAAIYVRSEHAPERAAKLYWSALTECSTRR